MGCQSDEFAAKRIKDCVVPTHEFGQWVAEAANFVLEAAQGSLSRGAMSNNAQRLRIKLHKICMGEAYGVAPPDLHLRDGGFLDEVRAGREGC